MARFAGTKRQQYTSDRVRKMRLERGLIKAKKDGVSNDQVQHYLGKLQAAGHMKMNNMSSFTVETQNGVNPGQTLKENRITFSSFIDKGMGERPHMVGYLTSASDRDKQYKLKGWFNEDGTFRLELVN